MQQHRYTRVQIVDENFVRHVQQQQLPELSTYLSLQEIGLTPKKFVELFETQMISRHLDFAARELRAKGIGFYTIGSAGHESNAAIGELFRHNDIAFLHYRSCGFFIQRTRKHSKRDAIEDVLLSCIASTDDPIAAGRHKVFGSVELFIPPQTSTVASHLPKAVGTALAIPRAKYLQLQAPLPYDGVVLCSFGDAGMNHSTALGALNTAALCSFQKIPLPLVLICEDNGIGVSVKTPPNWVETVVRNKPMLHYLKCDGRNILDTYRCAQQAESTCRSQQKPVFMHMKLVRLLGHAGSDIESQYHSTEEIEALEAQDPLLHSAKIALEQGILSVPEILDLYEEVRQRVRRQAEVLIGRPRFRSSAEVMQAILPRRPAIKRVPQPSSDKRQAMFGKEFNHLKIRQHMGRLLNWALADLMLQYPNTLLFGEDVAQKGGVYHITTGLRNKFGPRRVFNSPLDEQSILGTAIGFAHNGFLPLPEIQFLAYVHNAEDQIRGEAATLSFFSDGQFANPMVIRIPGLAYQKGIGGHFHNDNSLAVFRDIPGLIVACPSHGADAVKMLRGCLRTAHEEGRVVIFVEPIALYMTKDLHEKGDGLWLDDYPDPQEELLPGSLHVEGSSELLTIITYGNGYYLSKQAEKILQQQHDIQIKIIDLRWLAPLNETAIIDAVGSCSNVLIVDECRQTGSLSETLVTLLATQTTQPRRIERLTAKDSFIPLGEAANLLLPSKEDIVAMALKTLGRPHDSVGATL